MKQQHLCYACDDPATTKEHAPPFCFFPKGKRDNLWTVPSCETHNHAASLDVEYVGNVISYQYGTNATAEMVFETTKKSFDYSNKLFKSTVKGFKTTTVNGMETGQHPLDLKRLKSVMAAIAQALSSRDFGRQYIGKGRVVCANLKSEAPNPDWESLRAQLESGTYKPSKTPYPEVFEYGVHMSDEGFPVYRMVFYGGFVLYAWPRPAAAAAVA